MGLLRSGFTSVRSLSNGVNRLMWIAFFVCISTFFKFQLSTANAQSKIIEPLAVELPPDELKGSDPKMGDLKNSDGKPTDLNSTPLKLALKFVEFSNEDGSPVLSERRVKELVDRINPFFDACHIQFRLEDYQSIDSRSYGLSFKIQAPGEMKLLRKPFDEARYLVVIQTQSWDHDKMGAPNAWTAMPGEMPSGTVMESPVAFSPGLVAHELGHYLNLRHMNDVKNLMNPVIYRFSSSFTGEQCKIMRKTAVQDKAAALRDSVSSQSPLT